MFSLLFLYKAFLLKLAVKNEINNIRGKAYKTKIIPPRYGETVRIRFRWVGDPVENLTKIIPPVLAEQDVEEMRLQRYITTGRPSAHALADHAH